MKITDQVYALDCTRGAYAYAVLGDGVTLIDTGLPGRGKALLSELRSLGAAPGEIRRILLTHHDVDHIGNAAFLQKTSGCEVFISREDRPFAAGTRSRPGVKRLVGAMMRAKVPEEFLEIIDDNRIGEFDVLPAPGHTPGHTCFRLRDVLFTGDLFAVRNGVPQLSAPAMTWDRAQLIASIRSLPTEGIRVLCPAHGEPVRSIDTWKAFADGFADGGGKAQ